MGSGFGSLYPLTGQLLSPSSIDKLVKQLKFLENKGQEKTDDCEQLLQSRERERERARLGSFFSWNPEGEDRRHTGKYLNALSTRNMHMSFLKTKTTSLHLVPATVHSEHPSCRWMSTQKIRHLSLSLLHCRSRDGAPLPSRLMKKQVMRLWAAASLSHLFLIIGHPFQEQVGPDVVIGRGQGQYPRE